MSAGKALTRPTGSTLRLGGKRRLGGPAAPAAPDADGPADITAVKMQGTPITMFEGKRRRRR